MKTKCVLNISIYIYLFRSIAVFANSLLAPRSSGLCLAAALHREPRSWGRQRGAPPRKMPFTGKKKYPQGASPPARGKKQKKKNMARPATSFAAKLVLDYRTVVFVNGCTAETRLGLWLNAPFVATFSLNSIIKFPNYPSLTRWFPVQQVPFKHTIPSNSASSQAPWTKPRKC